MMTDFNNYSPLALAYMGDVVYEILVRKYVVLLGNQSVNNMHKKSETFVNAVTQSKIYYAIIDSLTEEEVSILKRGRNAKSTHQPKSASTAEYRNATGLEALFGYLFLCGKNDRIEELFNLCKEITLNVNELLENQGGNNG